MTTIQTIGTQIAKLRKDRNITQEDLAKKLGVSAQAVSKWGNGGAPDVEMLPEIADYFDVSIDYLLTGEDTFQIEHMKRPPINEKVLDTEVLKVYKTLAPEAKQDALKYLKLLQLKQKYTKKDV